MLILKISDDGCQHVKYLWYKVSVKIVHSRIVVGDWWSNCDEKNDVVTPKTFPFSFDIVFDAQVEGDIGTDTRRLLLSDVGLSNFDNAKAEERQSHSGPASEDDLAILCCPGFQPCNRILDISSDLVR